MYKIKTFIFTIYYCIQIYCFKKKKHYQKCMQLNIFVPEKYSPCNPENLAQFKGCNNSLHVIPHLNTFLKNKWPGNIMHLPAISEHTKQPEQIIYYDFFLHIFGKTLYRTFFCFFLHGLVS